MDFFEIKNKRGSKEKWQKKKKKDEEEAIFFIRLKLISLVL